MTALAAPWLSSADALRHAVERKIEQLGDLSIVTGGEARFALLPRPRLVLADVSIGDRSGALNVSTEMLGATIDPFALVMGHLEFSALQLHRPKISVNLDKAAEATLLPISDSRLPLGLTSILDGALRVTSKGKSYVAEHVDAALDWRRADEPLSLTGTFDWRGEKIEALLWAPRAAELFAGGATVTSMRLRGENVSLQAQGQTELGLNPRFAGHVALTATSARHALSLLGVAPALPGPLANARLSGEARIAPRDFELDRLQLAADGNEFTGRAALRREDERYALSAALTSSYVSGKEALAEAPPLLGADGQWNREPFSPTDFPGLNMDLRVSAAHARLGRIALDDAVLLVTQRDRAIDIELSEARAYRGALKMRLRLDARADGIDLRLDAQTRHVDAGAMLQDAVGRRAIGGALDATLTLDAAGGDVATIMRTVKGRVSATLADGELDGLDLERALRRLDQRPLASALDIRKGRTTLDTAALSATIEHGVAEFGEGEARGPGIALRFSGQADIAERTLLLHAAAHAAHDRENTPAASTPAQIAFDVSGAWDDLMLRTDAQSFIRRSDAAAPLLPAP